MSKPRRMLEQLFDVRHVDDLQGFPDMSLETLSRLLRSRHLVQRPDGTISRKHLYHVRRMRPGRWACCNACCGEICDEDRCCDCCNRDGACNRGKYLFRRESGDSNASIWSTMTAMDLRPKSGVASWCR